jgi:hypothetical protein
MVHDLNAEFVSLHSFLIYTWIHIVLHDILGVPLLCVTSFYDQLHTTRNDNIDQALHKTMIRMHWKG